MHVPEPIIDPADGTDPEHEALLADSVGLALLIVLETLTPAERLAFVLHDMFAVPFDEIAPIVDRSPEAARQLASRARRRVRGSAPVPDADLDRPAGGRRRVPRRAREGDFEALVAVLDPDVVLRADLGAVPAAARANSAAPRPSRARRRSYSRIGLVMRPVLVNGAAGAVTLRDGRPFSVGASRCATGGSSSSTSSATLSGWRELDLTVLDDD